tara:strand:- start:66 stop:758 length:693 start_codon:yes stop_codon:yes gene_type:complete
MKKALLTNPAFRYIFEIIVIVFSVTLSFYIQDILNEQEKIELKDFTLKGVLADLKKDSIFFTMGVNVKSKINLETEKFLNSEEASNLNIFWSMRRYYNFIGQNRNFNSMVSTGAIEYIKNKELSDEIHNYYGEFYGYLNDFSIQDREMFNDIVDYLNDNYKVISTEKMNLNSQIDILAYSNESLFRMKNDDIITSKLYHKKWMSTFYINTFEEALNINENLCSLIKDELK